MFLHFGPFLNEKTQLILDYISDKVHSDHRFFGDYKLSKLYTYPDNGEYTVEGVKITVANLGKYEIQNGMIIEMCSIILEGDVTDFIKNCEEHAMNIKIVPGKVNILVNNIYNSHWKIYEQLPTRSLSSGNEKILNDLKKFFSEETKDYYKRLEIPYSRIYMLYGPPGTGKTTLIHSLASELNKHIANLEFSKDMDDRTFRDALKGVPKNSILCIEDIDCLFQERKAHDSFSSTITFSGLLNTLDGLTRHDGLAIIITTNYLNTLDKALKRRVDYFEKFDYCTQTQTRNIFKKFCDESMWETFWRSAQYCKLTPNIIQKYFMKHPDMSETIKEFSSHEDFGNENMYN